METAIRLVPLRVPAGWVVRSNAFVDVDPPDLGRADPEWTAADLLCVEQLAEDAPVWWVALSWIERGDGHYRLLLRRDGSDRIWKRFVTRDREEVRITLEGWLDALTAATDERSATRFLGF